MNIVITLCLIFLAALTGYIVVKLAVSNREEKLSFLKSFKKGKFAILYFIAIPLYFIGLRYSGTDVGESILLSIRSVIRLAVLNFEFDPVKALFYANLYYRVVIDICFVLAVLNTLMLTFTLVGQSLLNAIKRGRSLRGKSKLFILVGYDASNASILKSVRQAGGRAVVFADLDAASKDTVFVVGESYLRFLPRHDLGTLIRAKARLHTKCVRIIVNTGNDTSNLILVKSLSDMICALSQEARASLDLIAYAFGEPENETAFVRFVEKSKGKIRYVNKYRLIATDFVGCYPLTRFMTDAHIDTENAALRTDVDVNVALVGFGKTNHRIFLTSVANDQLYTFDGAYRAKPVSYWIYDKKDTSNDKNLNHNYYRYSRSLPYFRRREDEFFALTDEPADIGAPDSDNGASHFVKMDINDTAFYLDVMERLKPKRDRKAFNYVVIAFGSDLENYDLAEKLSMKLKEWELSDFTKVFVKIRNSKLAGEVIAAEFLKDQSFFVFGSENEIVYRAERIVREENEVMAQCRHLCYAAESKRDQQSEEEVRRAALEKWYGEWNQVQRDSNIFACLSVRMKLNLLGYDYLPADCGLKDCSDLMMQKYTCGDEIRYADCVIEGRRVVDYGDCDFLKDTIRARFAEQEHQRWNAYMITSGYIPASIEETLYRGKSELMSVRKHPNLTTFEGLRRYREAMSEKTGQTVAKTDVIKYDYQIMDDAVWLLHRVGFVIVGHADAEKYRESALRS